MSFFWVHGNESWDKQYAWTAFDSYWTIYWRRDYPKYSWKYICHPISYLCRLKAPESLCLLVSMYSTVQWLFKSHSTYLPRKRSGEHVRLGIQRLLVRAHSAPLFSFQQCYPVGIAIFTGEDPQSEWMKRDESNRVYWFHTRFLSLVYL